MTQISLITQTKLLLLGLAVLQPFFTILCFSLFFRLRLTSAVLVSVIVLLYNLISEMLMYLLITRFQLEAFVALAMEATLLPAIFLSSLNSITALILSKMRVGFTFVQFNPKMASTNPTYTKRLFFIMSGGLILLMAIISSLFLVGTKSVLAYSLGTVLLIALIHYLYIKEVADT
ncbi:hypothetical protein YDYSG_13140 [Paenibacillus tyrfis]|uniref:hypothetical protein n=1 Tax=Paenibacillus tyrfis TaxID=1501230 RepID=UPI0024936858|nr:hypothetical protein [Paenibacillus tyrfis]GLI05284.1 hypothetical protein YDYSG_13140 [Paenibacillus tyrfis]